MSSTNIMTKKKYRKMCNMSLILKNFSPPQCHYKWQMIVIQMTERSLSTSRNVVTWIASSVNHPSDEKRSREWQQGCHWNKMESCHVSDRILSFKWPNIVSENDNLVHLNYALVCITCTDLKVYEITYTQTHTLTTLSVLQILNISASGNFISSWKNHQFFFSCAREKNTEIFLIFKIQNNLTIFYYC